MAGAWRHRTLAADTRFVRQPHVLGETMLNKVMIDFKGIEEYKDDLDEREYLLLPYIYLFADEILEPVVCKGAAFPEVDVPSFVKPVYIFHDNPPYVCDYAITTFKAGNPEYMGSYFTPVRAFKRRMLSVQGVTAYNSVLLLAAAGLELQLPALTFDVTRSEEIEAVREKLTNERVEYVDAVTRMADEAYERLESGSYEDTVDWALDSAFLKIGPKVHGFEKAMRSADRKLLERLGVSFVSEEIPAIGNAFLERSLKEGGRQIIVSVLKTLCSNLFRSMEERKYPEVLYGYKVARHLEEEHESAPRGRES